ncbi:MAG: hypothetical protein JKY55_17240 [Aliivibrio sp.]|uniref:hypothetical protein n=1 Tax=Aliivibrio sp. TaxID=1872443 RepID=UPI001A42AD6F|nr:hypothetical protein [Aliivibrio sp.]
MNIKKYTQPKYFTLEELIDQTTFNQFGNKAWWFLDEKALITLDQLREAFGALTVNNWAIGGAYQHSGFRHPLSAIGAKLSQHKFGRAFDVKSKHYTPEQMQAFIIANPERFPYITTIENASQTKTWLHFDVRLRFEPNIVVFNLVQK